MIHSEYNDDEYVCTLDVPSVRKARNELHEDPDTRLNAVKTLRKWIREQKHIKCPAQDTNMMLMFLRGAKFNVAKAQKMIEGNFSLKSKVPKWFLELDAHDESIQRVVESGYLVPLPKRTKDGCTVLIYRLGAIKPGEHTNEAIMRAGIVVGAAISKAEMTQVNGTVFIFDFTDVKTFGMPGLSRKDMYTWSKIWQNNLPGRFKGFHFYNAGMMFKVLMQFAKMFLPSKYQERMSIHSSKECLSQCIPSDLLPEEYIPENHKGTHSGSVKDIIENFKKEHLTTEFRNDFLYKTSNAFSVLH